MQRKPEGGHQLCSAAGPTAHFVAFDKSKTNSHFGILSRSISLTEEAFKKERPLGRSHSSRPPLFSPSFLLALGTDLAAHAHLLKRPVIARSLEPSGWEAFPQLPGGEFVLRGAGHAPQTLDVKGQAHDGLGVGFGLAQHGPLGYVPQQQGTVLVSSQQEWSVTRVWLQEGGRTIKKEEGQ
ncbi:hypothetical protein EYF80_013433 [Liparis tanakae]|uniref:Uncharacterized protein n=1 Tax=Liparis tanakae TaxID=230148 RepID=A0A4Z2IG14_9TELE|nr:hypothetical protein EYF80_013433 [Liparis tanakae]